jgi:predicted DNA-binding protein YlxM (UPF0122 family)
MTKNEILELIRQHGITQLSDIAALYTGLRWQEDAWTAKEIADEFGVTQRATYDNYRNFSRHIVSHNKKYIAILAAYRWLKSPQRQIKELNDMIQSDEAEQEATPQRSKRELRLFDLRLDDNDKLHYEQAIREATSFFLRYGKARK